VRVDNCHEHTDVIILRLIKKNDEIHIRRTIPLYQKMIQKKIKSFNTKNRHNEKNLHSKDWPRETMEYFNRIRIY